MKKAQNGKKMVKKTTVTKRSTGPKGETLGGEIGQPPFGPVKKGTKSYDIEKKKYVTNKSGGKMKYKGGGMCKGGC